jgi:hypothetical protein
VLRAAVGLFLYQLVIVLVIVARLPAIWALGYGGPFMHAYGTACLVFGCLALLFGALGLGGLSPHWGSWKQPGRGGTNPLPGTPAYFRTSPGTTAVNSTVIFFLTGIVLLVIGFLIR